MRPDQAEATARLAGRAAGGIVDHVERLHEAIAMRAFVPTQPASSPVRVLHEGITRLNYAAVKSALQAAAAVSGAVARLVVPGGAADIGSSKLGNHAVSALNAVIGEALSLSGDPLAVRMAIRAGGGDVEPTADGLRTGFPDATSKLAIFVHGLGENDDSWCAHAGDDRTMSFGTRLADDFGYTALYVRYNTGRHVSGNGRDLAALLEALCGHWPLPVDEILLAGHSMGGLVIRAACHYGARNDWVEAVRHAVYLGCPHTGAPLARGARVLAWAFDKMPETRAYGLLADHSPGVRDLRFGYIVDADWADCDAGTCLEDHAHDVPLLASADHYVISAAVTTAPRSPTAVVLGDLLVPPSSAEGRRRHRASIPFEPERIQHLRGIHHLDLLKHPAVYDTLRAWLRQQPSVPVTES